MNNLKYMLKTKYFYIKAKASQQIKLLARYIIYLLLQEVFIRVREIKKLLLNK